MLDGVLSYAELVQCIEHIMLKISPELIRIPRKIERMIVFGLAYANALACDTYIRFTRHFRYVC